MQATVREFDPASGSGSVFLDDGTVREFGPEAVMHQLTDLPDRIDELEEYASANDRIRSEGTRNLIAAAQAAAADRFVAQSIAWRSGNARDEVVDLHERRVLEIGGVVARYGRLYGAGTYYEDALPPQPRIQIDDAVRATPPLLEAPSGIVTIAEGGQPETRVSVPRS